MLVQARYGVDFLQVHRAAGHDLGHHEPAARALRLMGYWCRYIGVGLRRRRGRTSATPARCCSPPPVVAAHAARARAGARAASRWTRRWRYGPFFLAAGAASALLVMIAGFPEGTPLRRGADLHLQPRRRRPVPAHHLQGRAARGARRSPCSAAARRRAVAGVARGAAARPGRAGRRRRGRCSRRGLAAGRGPRARRAAHLEARSPPAWTRPARDLDRDAAARHARAWCCPASCSPSTAGAARSTRSCRALTDRPGGGAQRRRPTPTCTPSTCCGPSTSLVQQQRLLPGPARAAARPARSAARWSPAPTTTSAAAAAAARAVGARCSPARAARGPTQAYGPIRRCSRRRRATLGAARPRCPRCAATTCVRRAGIVRVEPRRRRRRSSTGRRTALAGWRRSAALPARGALSTPATVTPREIRARRAPGRRGRGQRTPIAAGCSSPSRLAQNVGLDAGRRRPALRGRRGARPVRRPRHRRARRWRCYERRALVRAPFSPGVRAVPRAPAVRRVRRRPADRVARGPRASTPTARWSRGRVRRARATCRTSTCCPTTTSALRGGTRVEVDGRHVPRPLRAGTGCALDLRGARVAAAAHRQDPLPARAGRARAACREVRVPGVPVTRAAAPAGRWPSARWPAATCATPLTYLFARTTGDAPSAASRRFTGPADRRGLRATAGTARRPRSRAVDRRPRGLAADAWVAPAPATPDDALDRSPACAGGRFDELEPVPRASRATAGVERLRRRPVAGPGSRDWSAAAAAWIGWTSPAPLTVSSLRLRPTPLHVRFPTRVRVAWPGGATPVLDRRSARGRGAPAAGPRALVPPRRGRRRASRRGPAPYSASGVRSGWARSTSRDVPAVRIPTSGPLRSSCALATVERRTGNRPPTVRHRAGPRRRPSAARAGVRAPGFPGRGVAGAALGGRAVQRRPPAAAARPRPRGPSRRPAAVA